MNCKEFRQEIYTMVQNGFTHTYPPFDVRSEEKECIKVRCDNCWNIGADFVPYYNRKRKLYRAFKRCPKCGHAREF